MDIKHLLEELEALELKPAEMKKAEYNVTDIKEPELDCAECEVKKLIKQFESLEEDDELGLFIINDGDIYRQYSSKAQKDAKEGKDVDWDKITAIGARKYYKEIDKTPFTPEELKNTAEYIKDYYINESEHDEVSSIQDSIDYVKQELKDLENLMELHPEDKNLKAEYDAVEENLLRLQGILNRKLQKIDSLKESKINEISDKLANTVANFRKANAHDAKQKLRALDDEHTAELTKIDNNYTNRDIMLGKADKDIDYVNSKYKPLENEQRKIIKKAEKNADLMVKRKLRLSSIKNESKINEISDKLASKVVSKRMAQYKKEGDELDKQAADVVNAQNSLNPNVREIEKEYGNNLDNFFGGIKQKAHKLYRTINKRAERLNKENEYGQYFDSLRKNESKINEISQELADNVNTQRQVNALKAAVKYVNDKTEENREEAKELRDKAQANNKLYAKWKKAKGIKENILKDQKDAADAYTVDYKAAQELFDKVKTMDKQDIIKIIPDPFNEKEFFQSLSKPELIKLLLKKKFNTAGEDLFLRNKNLLESKKEEAKIAGKFQDGKKVHEIIRTPEGEYKIRYDVKNGKAKTVTAGVKSLPVAIDALKKKCPKAEQITESTINEISAELKDKVSKERTKNLNVALKDYKDAKDKYDKARDEFENADPLKGNEEDVLDSAQKELNNTEKELDKARRKYIRNQMKF